MRIPEPLTQFYRSWGRRSDMVRSRETLLALDRLTIQSGALFGPVWVAAQSRELPAVAQRHLLVGIRLLMNKAR